MVSVLVVMCLGMVIGFVLRNQTKFIALSNKLITYMIFVLLFLLGVGVGSNEKLVNNFHAIGYKAVIISLSSILFSVILSYVVYVKFFKTPKNER